MRISLALACGAIAAPALLPIGAPPLVSLYTEATALLGWGLWLAWWASQPAGRWWPNLPQQPALAAALAVVGLCLAGVLASASWRGLPWPIAVRHAGLLGAAAVALLGGARLAAAIEGPAGAATAGALLWALLLAGLGSAAVAVLQYLGIDGPWERLGRDGRAGGNLAQPNLLGTQLLWAIAALVALVDASRARRRSAVAGAFAALLLVSALALSASRSAALGCGLLALWGLLDRRLGAASRGLLVAVPVALALAWVGLEAWHGAGGPGFAGTGLLHKADPSSSRWRLWQQCALLVEQHPLWGVGWGQFNFAWTLTAMPGLPRTAGYTFGHAHNLAVHWAVELGLPLALAMLALLLVAGLRSASTLWRGQRATPVARRAAWVMVAIVLLHSLFELPLWHAHFLLPSALLMGLALGSWPATPAAPRPASAVAPLLIALAAAWALLDYRTIAAVYSPGPDDPPLQQRIEAARGSPLFGHFAGRLVATLAPVDRRQLADYRATAFEIIDWRLLASWAQAYAEAGEVDKARYLAARLREFDSPAAQLVFATCARDPSGFACQPAPPGPGLGFEAFRP